MPQTGSSTVQHRDTFTHQSAERELAAAFNALRARFNALLAKLDADVGVTDVNYASTLGANVAGSPNRINDEDGDMVDQ